LKIYNQDNLSNIDFKTLKEVNCDYITIEKSSDQINFDSIGIINAIGNSLVPLKYKFKLKSEDAGLKYYRLKAINKNRESKYSQTFSIPTQYGESNSLSLYPNPVKSGLLYLDYLNQTESTEAVLTILDVYGRAIRSVKEPLSFGINYFNINVSGISNGLHYLSITSTSDSKKSGFTISQ
jgi:hypothetical protein